MDLQPSLLVHGEFAAQRGNLPVSSRATTWLSVRLTLDLTPLRSRPLRRREDVRFVPGVEFDGVAVALDRDHAPHPKLWALPE